MVVVHLNEDMAREGRKRSETEEGGRGKEEKRWRTRWSYLAQSPGGRRA
jgi:hypothetical protein